MDHDIIRHCHVSERTKSAVVVRRPAVSGDRGPMMLGAEGVGFVCVCVGGGGG